jgi:hypothetical protein
MEAVELPDDECVGQREAAKILGITLATVGYLLAAEILDAAQSGSDKMAVTRASVERELAWRRSATYRHRLRRWLTSWLRFL